MSNRDLENRQDETHTETSEVVSVLEAKKEPRAQDVEEKTPAVVVPEPMPEIDTLANQTVDVVVKDLPKTDTGDQLQLKIYRFGCIDARPKVYLQAGLHADELPGQLVLRYLVEDLERAVERGELAGQIVVVPVKRRRPLPASARKRSPGHIETDHV
ncbi:MAG: succinylglutamate desuccinylase/aspartoacylase family protein, partial [Pseudomonadota bacterium]